MNRSALLFVSVMVIAFQLCAADAPVANPDTAKVVKNSAPVLINVLANDTGSGLRVTAVTQGDHGTVTLANSTNVPGGGVPNGSSAVLYKPNTDYVGPDHFTYTLTDSNGATAVGDVGVQVDPPAPPPPPLANPDTAKVFKNSVNNFINVLANDSGVGLVISAVTQGDHGVVKLVTSTAGANGVASGVLYTPATDYVGPDHFTYTITSSGGGSSTATVSVTVEAPLPPPLFANPDFAKVAKNSSNNPINVLQNDVGTGLRITAVTQGAHGSVTIPTTGPAVNALAGVLYTPNTDYVGEDHFTYTITDSTGRTATANVGILVEAPTPPPIANPDFARVLKNSASNPINVLSNDVGVGLSITSVTQADHGTVTIALPVNGGANIIGNGFCIYVPNQDYVGGDHFTYKITDSNGGTATGTVTIQVDGPTTPPPPIAAPDFAKVAKNSTNNPIDVLKNDVGTNLVIIAVTQGDHGKVEIPATIAVVGAVQVVFYTPNADYVGPDHFTYTIKDSSGATAKGDVAIQVESPTPVLPIANPDFATVNKNSPAVVINVILNDIGLGLKVTAVTQGDHGTVQIVNNTANPIGPTSVSYKPDTDYVGEDHFSYTITDANGATAEGRVGILVRDNTPPKPVANPDSIRVAKNSTNNPVNVLQNDVGSGLKVTAVTQGAHGSVALVTGPANAGANSGVTYTPDTDYVGLDEFTYTITDSNNATAVGKVSVQVGDSTPPMKPIAVPDFAKVDKNSEHNAIDVLRNDIGMHLSITAVTQGHHGKVEIPPTIAVVNAPQVVAYTPDTDYVGPDEFTYTITDSAGATAVGKVVVQVGENAPPKPIANPDFAKVAKNSENNVIKVLQNDVGTGLTITAVTQGDHGSVEIPPIIAVVGAVQVVLYTPDADYVGPDHFTYTIKDSNGATAVGRVEVQVGDITPPPPPILANPDFAKVRKDSTDNAINVLQNDIGTGLSIASVTQGDHGTVKIAPANAVNQIVLYTPAAGYTGPDAFTYTITGANNTTATGKVSVYVSDENAGPRVNPDFATTQKNSAGVDINVLANDIGAGLTIADFTQPDHGKVTATAGGVGLTYVPAQDFVGLDRFSYTAADTNGQKAKADVSVLVVAAKAPRVLAQASPPVAAPGETIAFFAQVVADTPGNAAVVVFSWDFGDGSTAKGQNPTHAYTTAGTYTATVTVTSGNSTLGSATVTVLIKSGDGSPIARFTISDVAAVAGSPITFDAAASFDPGHAIASYDWDFGDGSTHGNTVVVKHIYDQPGAYSVKLTVTNALSLSDSVTRLIQVLDKNAPFKSRVRYVAKLNFTANAIDTLSLSALLNVGDTAVGAGTEVGCTIAGVTFTGTLDNRLQDNSSPNERWSVKTSGAVARNAGDLFLQLNVKKASLAQAFAAAGAVPGNDPTTPVSIDIPVTLSVADRSVDLVIETKVLFTRNANRATAIGDGP